MKNKTWNWVLRQIRCRIPAMILLTIAQMGYALLGVLFALGSRGVIDRAVGGDRQAFLRACGWQLAIVVGILLCMTLVRYLKERLNAQLERDWKRRLLHKLLDGDYEKVSSFHSAELINRMNNDVRKLNEGILGVIPM